MNRPHIIRWLGLAATAMFLVAIVVFGYLFVRAQQDIARTMKRSEVTKIGHAMCVYESKHKAFPPRFIIHNETVHTFWPILLEIEIDSETGASYDVAQSWDSTPNLAAAARASHIVCTEHLSYLSQTIPAASFVAVDDLATILSSDHPVTATEVTDGCENTLLVAEVSKINLPWAKPASERFEGFVESCTSSSAVPGGERLVGFPGQLLLFADFEIYHLARQLPESLFQALWTRDGGEGVSREQLIRDGYLTR